MDTAIITVHNYALNVVIGAYDHERHAPQPIYLTAKITILTHATHTDRLTDTLDYDTVLSAIKHRVEARSYTLIEALSSDILAQILHHCQVVEASVTVTKPQALTHADGVSVQLSSRRFL